MTRETLQQIIADWWATPARNLVDLEDRILAEQAETRRMVAEYSEGILSLRSIPALAKLTDEQIAEVWEAYSLDSSATWLIVTEEEKRIFTAHRPQGEK